MRGSLPAAAVAGSRALLAVAVPLRGRNRQTDGRVAVRAFDALFVALFGAQKVDGF